MVIAMSQEASFRVVNPFVVSPGLLMIDDQRFWIIHQSREVFFVINQYPPTRAPLISSNQANNWLPIDKLLESLYPSNCRHHLKLDPNGGFGEKSQDEKCIQIFKIVVQLPLYTFCCLYVPFRYQTQTTELNIRLIPNLPKASSFGHFGIFWLNPTSYATVKSSPLTIPGWLGYNSFLGRMTPFKRNLIWNSRIW